jgi:hypothetical protein
MFMSILYHEVASFSAFKSIVLTQYIIICATLCKYGTKVVRPCSTLTQRRGLPGIRHNRLTSFSDPILSIFDNINQAMFSNMLATTRRSGTIADSIAGALNQ